MFDFNTTISRTRWGRSLPGRAAAQGQVAEPSLLALPQVPLPNDIATRPDRHSPTGLRLNASALGPTEFESEVRRQLDRRRLEGAVVVTRPATGAVLALATRLRAEGRDIISLGTGEPDFDTPAELWDSLRGEPALTIAHHSAGGPIAVDWSFAPDPVLVPITEIVSVHGSSESLDSPGAIYSPVPGNFVRDVLARGYRLGFVGSPCLVRQAARIASIEA